MLNAMRVYTHQSLHPVQYMKLKQSSFYLQVINVWYKTFEKFCRYGLRNQWILILYLPCRNVRKYFPDYGISLRQHLSRLANCIPDLPSSFGNVPTLLNGWRVVILKCMSKYLPLLGTPVKLFAWRSCSGTSWTSWRSTDPVILRKWSDVS